MDTNTDKPPRIPIPYTEKDCPHCGSPRCVKTVDGSEMRRIRKETGRSMRSVARLLGISPAYLGDMELGRRWMSRDVAARVLEICQRQEGGVA